MAEAAHKSIFVVSINDEEERASEQAEVEEGEGEGEEAHMRRRRPPNRHVVLMTKEPNKCSIKRIQCN